MEIISDGLKPCPFCGKQDMLEFRPIEHNDRPSYKYIGQITCLNCFASIITHGFEMTEEEAKCSVMDAWNKRV